MRKWATFNELLGDLSSGGSHLETIAKLSRYFGQFSLEEDGYQYSYLGGGNTSVNLGDSVFVKLSGHGLSTIEPKGFGMVDVKKVLNGLGSSEELCDSVLKHDYTKDFGYVKVLDQKVARLFRGASHGDGDPSVETGFHAQLSGTHNRPRWNIHDHNTVKNSLLCSNNAEQAYTELFGGDISIRFMEFVEPGAPLSIVFNRKMKEWKNQAEPKVIFMAQHGTIQTGYSPQEVYDLDQMVLEKIFTYSKAHLPEFPFGVDSFQMPDSSLVDEAYNCVKRCFPEIKNKNTKGIEEKTLVMKLLFSEIALATIAQGMSNPDAAVYGRAVPMVVDFKPGDNASTLRKKTAEAKEQYIRRYRHKLPLNLDRSIYLPRIVLIPGVCAVTMGESEKQATNAYAALVDTVYVMRGAEAFGGMKPLSYKHLFYITNWRAEARREKMASRIN